MCCGASGHSYKHAAGRALPIRARQGWTATVIDTMRLPTCLAAALLALFAVPAVAAPAAKAEKALRLKCEWELSQDLKTGLVQRVSGVQMLLFRPTGSTYGQLEIEGMPNPFPATFSDTYLTADAKYKSGATPMTEKLEVNRYTGGIRKWLRWGDSGSLYQGKCTRVTGALF